LVVFLVFYVWTSRVFTGPFGSGVWGVEWWRIFWVPVWSHLDCILLLGAFFCRFPLRQKKPFVIVGARGYRPALGVVKFRISFPRAVLNKPGSWGFEKGVFVGSFWLWFVFVGVVFWFVFCDFF